MSHMSNHYEKSVNNLEGSLTNLGVLSVKSGKHTARHASAKFIVDEGLDDIGFNEYHQRISKKQFLQYWHIAENYLASNHTTGQYQVGNHPQYNIHLKLTAELHWHQLFASHMFLPIKDQALEHWEVLCAPNLVVSTSHPVFIGICLSERRVLISGTGYAGEIKKAMFTVANIRFPDNNVLPLHCSAVLSPRGNSTLLLGLSGTGKTTLSSTSCLQIIGDDEHGWCDEGVFNLEGGCYAKVINLSPQDEQQIYQALKPPAILENVILDENNRPDFYNDSITENLRAAYPLQHLTNHYDGTAPHPKDIIFLCCDVYGVIPAASLLTPRQAESFFTIGYTAKIGGTEVNMPTVTHVSSPCFGLPFFPKKLSIYQKMFSQRIQQHQCRVWLVNTGWGQGGLKKGSRYPISVTRKVIHDIIYQQMESNTMALHPKLGLHYFTKTTTDDIDIALPKFWLTSRDFERNCDNLLSLFKQSLNQYAPSYTQIGID